MDDMYWQMQDELARAAKKNPPKKKTPKEGLVIPEKRNGETVKRVPQEKLAPKKAEEKASAKILKFSGFPSGLQPLTSPPSPKFLRWIVRKIAAKKSA